MVLDATFNGAGPPPSTAGGGVQSQSTSAIEKRPSKFVIIVVARHSLPIPLLHKSIFHPLSRFLTAAPNNTLNIRKANLELRTIKNLAKANPGLLKLGGKGAWPTVTLLK